MTIAAKLKWMDQRGAKRGYEFKHAPEHERRVSSWVRHKVLALKQSVKDEFRVWELCLWHGGGALNVAGVRVASFTDGWEVDVVQRTISPAKVVAITDICSRWMREIVIEVCDHFVLEPLAKPGVW